MNNILKITLLILLSTLVTCGDLTQSEKNSKAIKEAIKNREIKKVSDVDILNRAMIKGDSLAVQCKVIFQLNLDQQSGSIDVNNVITQTELQLDSAITNSKGEISFITLAESGSATDLEKQLLEAYQYNVQHGLNLNASVQILHEVSQVLYIDPVVITDDQCSSCSNNDVSGLIGMWAIKFPVKKIVSEL